MIQNTVFTLDSLIENKHLLEMQKNFSDILEVVEYILPRDSKNNIAHPLLIGIDGSVTAGKTYCTQVLKQIALKHQLPHHAIHCDWFMSPRSIRAQEIERAQSKDYSFEKYDNITCDFKRIKDLLSQIHNFVESKKEQYLEYTINPAYDRLSGECKNIIHNSIHIDSIVTIDGGGLLNAECHKFFDVSIRLDISDTQEVIDRLHKRETNKGSEQLSSKFITERYLKLDFPFDNYLRSRDRAYFGFLINTTDFKKPRLFIRPQKWYN